MALMRSLMRILCLYIIVLVNCISHCVSDSQVLEWSGGGGLWSDSGHWVSRSVPDENSMVIIAMDKNDVIVIDRPVVIHDLILAGGIINILSTGSLVIENQLLFERGTFSGPDRCCSAGGMMSGSSYSYGLITVHGNSSFTGPDRKRFRSVLFHQDNNFMTWTGGDVVLYNSTLHVGTLAKFIVDSNATKDLRIVSDKAFDRFDCYPDAVLNVAIDLKSALPIGSAVYDMMVPDIVKISTSTASGVEIFDLLVGQDLSAIEYFSTKVPHLHTGAAGYSPSMYNRTIIQVDEDQCASACTEEYGSWCRSFDYSVSSQICRMSCYGKAQVGGLTTTTAATVIDSRSNHYELRKKQALQSSKLAVDGSMLVTSSGLVPTQVSIYVDVQLAADSSGLVVDGSTTLQLFALLDMHPYSSLIMSPYAVVLLSGPDSSLQMAPGSYLVGGSADITGSAMIAFSGGLHYINSSVVNGSLSISLVKSARLQLSSFNSSLNMKNNYGYIGLDSLVVSEGSVLTMTSMRSGSYLSSRSVHLLDRGRIISNNLTLEVDDVLLIDSSSSISADGTGHAVGDGPAAGIPYTLGGSGGAHGGFGGSSKVQSTGVPYDPYWSPSRPGSGGGVGFSRGDSSSKGGFGGGVLFVSVSGHFTLDGVISSDGAAGVLASGGGAGGTVFITARRLLGSGMISCRGGDGGFSGGTASGGGGSGGRVALHLAELLFDGQFDITGGYRKPTYDVPNAKQAGPGTVFIAAGTGIGAGNNNEILALVTSSQVFGNCTTNLRNRSPLSPTQVVEPISSSSSYEGSFVRVTSNGTDGIPLPTGYKCNVDVHVIGDAPLTVSGGEFCFYHLVGSSRGKLATVATVQASDQAVLSYNGSSLNLQTMRLALYDASFLVDPVIEISKEGSLSLHRDLWFFDSLSVGAGGALEVYSDDVLIAADRISLLSGSTVSLFGDLTLQSQRIDVRSSSLGRMSNPLGSSSSSNANLILSESSVIDMSGNVSVSSTNIYVRGSLAVKTSLSVLKHSRTDSSTVTLAESGSITVSPSAILSTESMIHLEGNISLGVSSNFSSSSSSSSSSILRLQSDAVCGATGILTIPIGSELHVQTEGSLLMMQEGCSITGRGRILLNGILLPPADLPASTPPIHVAIYGELRVQANDSSSTRGSFVIRSELFIEEGGRLVVSNDTTLRVEHLFITGGSVVLNSNHSSLLLANNNNNSNYQANSNNNILDSTDHAYSFHDGFILGSGSLVVSHSSVLQLRPSHWGSLTVLEATLVNNGTIEASDGTVYFGRGAAVINNAAIVFAGDQKWIHREDLYGYNDPIDCSGSFGLTDSAGSALYGLTIEECATSCTYHLIEQTREQAVRYVATEYVQCHSFLYNDLLMTCQVLTLGGARDSQKSCTAAATKTSPSDGRSGGGAWRLFGRNLQWTSPPTLYNSGALYALASSTSFVGIELMNSGLIRSEAQGHLNISTLFHQSSSGSIDTSGLIAINANQAHHRSRKESSISGSLSGDGLLYLQATTASHKSGIILQPDVSVNSPQLTIRINGNIRIDSSYSVITLLNLHLIDDAHVLIQNSSLHFNITNKMQLMGSSCIETASNMLTGPSSSDLFSTIAFSLPSAALPLSALNVDVLITASQLVLNDSSRLVFANAYILADSSIVVTSSSEIASTGRGFDGATVGGNYSLWAGQFGFLGSQGGSYGGFGGMGYGAVTAVSDLSSSRWPYGDFFSAHDWGAPGGRGTDGKYSPGGGSLTLVTKLLRLEGCVRSDGFTPIASHAGGGAGGSVHLVTDSLTGGGSISANGGRGGRDAENTVSHGGGGGGMYYRIYHVSDATARI